MKQPFGVVVAAGISLKNAWPAAPTSDTDICGDAACQPCQVSEETGTCLFILADAAANGRIKSWQTIPKTPECQKSAMMFFFFRMFRMCTKLSTLGDSHATVRGNSLRFIHKYLTGAGSIMLLARFYNVSPSLFQVVCVFQGVSVSKCVSGRVSTDVTAARTHQASPHLAVRPW